MPRSAQALLLTTAVLTGPLLSGCGGSNAASGPGASATAPAGTPKVRRTARSGGFQETTFDDIKFEQDPAQPYTKELLTPQVKERFGQDIRIRGYIYPTLKQKGIKQFVLVRDNLECCFGPGAALYDCILVTMVDGETAEYSIRPVAVEGNFRYEEMLGPDGTHLAIYQMDAVSVR
ncbi:MAG: DUF3299 domain-containing protein [Planctomycetota bacterium]